MCVGIPGKIIELDKDRPEYAWAEVSGVRREVNILLVCNDEEPKETLVGTWVLIHVGFAMSRLDEEAAKETIKALQAMGELEEDAAQFLARAH